LQDSGPKKIDVDMLYDELDELNQRNEILHLELEREKKRNRELLAQQQEDHDLIREFHELGTQDNERLALLESRLSEEIQSRADTENKHVQAREKIDLLTDLMREADNKSKSNNNSSESDGERRLRSEYERKFSLLQIDRDREKERDETNTKLLSIMQEKLNRALEERDTIAERLNDERRRQEKECEEIDSLRDEVCRMCDVAVKQREESDSLKKNLDSTLKVQEQLRNDLALSREEEAQLRDQLQQRNHDFEQSKLLLEGEQKKLLEIESEIFQNMSQIEEELANANEAIAARDQTIEELEQTKHDLIEKENIDKQEREKEEAQRCLLADRVVELEIDLSQKQDRLEKITVQFEMHQSENKRKGKKLEELTAEVKALTEISADLETKLRKAERERTTLNERLDFQKEELNVERARCQRTLNQLEDTTEALRSTQLSLNDTNTKHKEEITYLEVRTANKEAMLEKKCVYLKKLVEQARGSHADTNQHVREEELLSLMTQNEELSTKVLDVERRLVVKQQEIDSLNDKMRQIEEVTTMASPATQNKKGTNKDKVTVLEGLINEVCL
jgi:hypothetical protein